MSENVVEHELKCWPEFFEAVVSLRKRFEIRRNDRDFKVGNVLRLREYRVPESDNMGRMQGGYTGRECRRRVSYITDWEQKPDIVVMGLSDAPIDAHVHA